jgi:hypothetical protein
MGLWVRAGAFCAQQLTDGFVPDHMIASLGTPAQAERLVSARLWMREDGGFLFHEWAEHGRQPLRADVEAEREAARKRMAERRQKARSGKGVQPNNERTSAEVQEKFGNGSATPTRPDPTRPPVPTAQVASPEPDGSAQTLVAEWIDHCGQRPPGRVVGQIAKEVGLMLDEGIPYHTVRGGLIAWQQKGLHPSTLASIVHEAATSGGGKSRRQSETDGLFSRALERAAQYDAQEAAQ